MFINICSQMELKQFSLFFCTEAYGKLNMVYILNGRWQFSFRQICAHYYCEHHLYNFSVDIAFFSLLFSVLCCSHYSIIYCCYTIQGGEIEQLPSYYYYINVKLPVSRLKYSYHFPMFSSTGPVAKFHGCVIFFETCTKFLIMPRLMLIGITRP